MRKLVLALAACSLLACSSSKSPSSGHDHPDGGHGNHEEDTQQGGLERPGADLARPPTKKLPDDLKPPGYDK